MMRSTPEKKTVKNTMPMMRSTPEKTAKSTMPMMRNIPKKTVKNTTPMMKSLPERTKTAKSIMPTRKNSMMRNPAMNMRTM